MDATFDKRGESGPTDPLTGTCPVCNQGDLITITMAVGESDFAFTTCHLCEAKWWYRDGEAVPLRSVIGSVLSSKN
ncbi:MAG: hypothetical protein ACE14W_03800 [Candidatus Velamenicoccus archaeovorus]